MTKKIIIIVVCVLIIAAAAFIIIYRGAILGEKASAPASPVSNSQTVSAQPGKTYNTTDPAKVAVPEIDSNDVPANVAKPNVVSASRVGADSSIRSFEVSIEKDSMAPATIIVRQNDTVHIKINAVGKEYKVVQPDYGLKTTIAAGESQVMEFSASASGKYSLLCNDCAGVNQTTLGYILVTPQ